MATSNSKTYISLISMILGILGLVTACVYIGIIPCIAGLILSIIALKNKSGRKVISIIGLITSILGIVLFFCLLSATSPSDTSTQNVNKQTVPETEVIETIADVSTISSSEELPQKFIMETETVTNDEPIVDTVPISTPETTQELVQEEIIETNQAVLIPEEPTVKSTPEPQEPTPETSSGSNSSYAVNGSNGKIHMVDACPATGTGTNVMKNPVYFDTYEEAEAYSITINPGQDKRNCGNCW